MSTKILCGGSPTEQRQRIVTPLVVSSNLTRHLKDKKIFRHGAWVKINKKCVDCKRQCKEPYYTKIIRCYEDEEKH
jgi:hypothetical protein